MPPLKVRHASPEVLAVLQASTLDEHGLQLPGQLSRSDYLAVNQFLELAGLRWNRKQQRHVFTTPEAETTLRELLASGEVVDKQASFQQYYTPAAVAERLVAYLDDCCPGQRRQELTLLEPSAGRGSLSQAAAARGYVVDCVELDPDNFSALANDVGNYRRVECADFLSLPPVPAYHAVLMNPPFTRGQDLKHVRHAYGFLQVSPGSRLIAVMTPSWQTGTTRAAVEFREWFEDFGGEVLEELPAGTFREAGTDVRTVVVEISA